MSSILSCATNFPCEELALILWGTSPKSGLPLSQGVSDPLLAFPQEGEQLPSNNHRKQAGERIFGLSYEWAQINSVGMQTRARRHA